MVNAKTFAKSLPIVAKALGEKLGVNVVIHGSAAYTDGKTIVIPSVDLGDEKGVALATGYIDHEAAHVRLTDQNVYKRQAQKGPLEARLMNIFEDIFIEQSTMQKYPGSKKNLNELVRIVTEEGGFSYDQSDDASSLIQGYLLVNMRYNVLGNQAVAGNVDNIKRKARATFSAKLIKRLDQIMGESHSMQSTSDAAKLANKAIKAIRDEVKQQQEKQQEQEKQQQQQQDQEQEGQADQSGSESQDGDESSNGQTSGDSSKSEQDSDEPQSGGQQSGDQQSGDQSSDGKSGGQSASDADSDDADDPSQAGTSDSSEDCNSDASSGASSDDARDSGHSPQGGNESRASDEVDPQSIVDDIQRSMNGESNEAKTDLGALAKEALSDRMAESMPQQRVELPSAGNAERPNGGGRYGCVDRNHVDSQMRALRKRIASKLRAQDLVNTRPVRSGRRIDKKSLHRIRVGDTRIFQGKQSKPKPNTAVTMLIDQSASMRQERCVLATETCMAMLHALDNQKGIYTSAYGYSGCDTDELLTYKTIGQNAPSAMSARASGGTPASGAMWYAITELQRLRRVTRRIIVNVTDGSPNRSDSMRDSVDVAGDLGIEVIGIGVQYDVLSEHAHHHLSIAHVDELPGRVFKTLEGMLIDNKAA